MHWLADYVTASTSGATATVTHHAEQPLTLSQKFLHCKRVGQQLTELTALSTESGKTWSTSSYENGQF